MPARPPFAAGDDDKGTDAEVRADYDGYVAYFGTYRVDEANSVVTHVVEGSLKPSYTGTDQPRPFKLDGDVLDYERGHWFLRLLLVSKRERDAALIEIERVNVLDGRQLELAPI
jgi:hypothetical protein